MEATPQEPQCRLLGLVGSYRFCSRSLTMRSTPDSCSASHLPQEPAQNELFRRHDTGPRRLTEMLKSCPKLGRFVVVVNSGWDNVPIPALLEQLHLLPRLSIVRSLTWSPRPRTDMLASHRPRPVDLTLNVCQGRQAALATRLDLSALRRLELRIRDHSVAAARSLGLAGLAPCLEDLTLSACIEHTYTELVRVALNPDRLRSLRLRTAFETADDDVLTPREDPLSLHPHPLVLFPQLETLHIDFPPESSLFADGHAALTTVVFLSYSPWFDELDEPGHTFTRSAITALCNGAAERPSRYPSLKTLVWHPVLVNDNIFATLLPDLRSVDAFVREVGLAFEDGEGRSWSSRLREMEG